MKFTLILMSSLLTACTVSVPQISVSNGNTSNARISNNPYANDIKLKRSKVDIRLRLNTE